MVSTCCWHDGGHASYCSGVEIQWPWEESHPIYIMGKISGLACSLSQSLPVGWTRTGGSTPSGYYIAIPSRKKGIELLNRLNMNIGKFPTIREQIEDLKTLKEGWLDGEGKKPTEQYLIEMANWCERVFPAKHLIYVYPTFEGFIQVEWTQGHWSVDVDFNLSGGTLSALHLGTLDCYQAEGSLDEIEKWVGDMFSDPPLTKDELKFGEQLAKSLEGENNAY